MFFTRFSLDRMFCVEAHFCPQHNSYKRTLNLRQWNLMVYFISPQPVFFQYCSWLFIAGCSIFSRFLRLWLGGGIKLLARLLFRSVEWRYILAVASLCWISFQLLLSSFTPASWFGGLWVLVYVHAVAANSTGLRFRWLNSMVSSSQPKPTQDSVLDKGPLRTNLMNPHRIDKGQALGSFVSIHSGYPISGHRF